MTNNTGGSIMATGAGSIGVLGLGLNITNNAGATISGGSDGAQPARERDQHYR